MFKPDKPYRKTLPTWCYAHVDGLKKNQAIANAREFEKVLRSCYVSLENPDKFYQDREFLTAAKSHIAKAQIALSHYIAEESQ